MYSITTEFGVLNCSIQCLTVYKTVYKCFINFRDSQTSSPPPVWLYLVPNVSPLRDIKSTVSKSKQNQEELMMKK